MLFWAGFFLALVSVGQLLSVVFSYREEHRVYGNIRDMAYRLPSSEEEGGPGLTGTESDFSVSESVIDFEALQEMNEDIIGWIDFAGGGISYPLLRGEDNRTYLHTMPDGSENQAGSIFVDAECSPDFSDFHTIVYGHNMRDGSMFGSLKKYRTDEKFYRENPYFTVYLPGRVYTYGVFAWYEVPADDEVYRIGFQADAQFGEFVEQMLERRERDTGITADGTDRIVTLSTCSSEGKRVVVHAKRIIKER